MKPTKSQSGTIAPFLHSLRSEDESAVDESQTVQTIMTPPVIANKAQLVLLDALAAHDGNLRMAELETETGFDSPALTSAILAAVMAGFVAIDGKSGDIVRLTKGGRDALDRFNS